MPDFGSVELGGHRRRRSGLAIAMVLMLFGCAQGLTKEPYDLTELLGDQVEDDGGYMGGEGGTTGGSEAFAQGGGGAGGSASSGNPTDNCGDGMVAMAEECDDGNTVDGDGCTACVVDCDAGDVKDPVSHHCYHLVTLEADWQTAENDCMAWGGAPGLGHLVSITSAGEQALVQALGQGHVRWIGGTDAAVEDNYEWTDGEPFSFVNWRSGEPNNNGINGGEEDCAEIEDDGQWDDQPCEKTKRYVCERSAAGVMP